MESYTRADLMKMVKSEHSRRVAYYTRGVYGDVCANASKGLTQHTTNMIFPQDLLEDTKVSLQQLFPDSKIEIVDKVDRVPKFRRILGFAFDTNQFREKKYRAIQIDWSIPLL
jgi:hypothetical protein